MKNTLKTFLLFLGLALVSITYSIAISPSASSVTDNVKVYFLDVGQGDAELIQQGNYQILIDGGPDDRVLAELGKVMPLYDHTIEMLILTHPHADHITGLNAVLERYKVHEVIGNGTASTSSGYTEFLSKLKAKNLSLTIPAIGNKVTPFDHASLEFFWPGSNYLGKSDPNLNNTSEVFRFCYYSHCALFTGDIEQDGLSMMFEANQDRPDDFRSQILKMSHHGSRNGASEELIIQTKPRYVVIEVGKDNKFVHPHKEALDLLAKYHVAISRTDQDGTVEFTLTK